MKVFVLNAGSSSIKYQLFNMKTNKVLTSGLVEQIGEPLGRIKYKWVDIQGENQEGAQEARFESHSEGLKMVFDVITKLGIIKDPYEIYAVGHRVLHGGEAIWKPTIITDRIVDVIEEMIPLGPLHNPANLKGIRFMREMAPDLPQVAVFDTAFGQTMPPYAYHYALPDKYYRELRIRRYGFHGTSHYYVSKQAALFMGRPYSDCNIITMHLGNGSSCTAIKHGKCVDTSMGMTPLEGLMMGTRSGDMDPAIVCYIGRQMDVSFEQLDSLLNKESGMKGVCGTNDMREIKRKAAGGDMNAALAIDMFCYRIKKYIGAYSAVLNRVDALVFTGGIGENATTVRRQSCSDLDYLGIKIDVVRNSIVSSEARTISTDDSRVKVLVIPTNEELEIAQQTIEAIGDDKKVY
jgi:acetate kinase